MKRFYVFLIFFAISAAHAQTVNFGTSQQFKSKMIASNTIGGIAYNSAGAHMKADANSNGAIEISEALAVYEIRIDQNYSMQGLTGLEYFTNLRVFTIMNTGIAVVDLQPLVNLELVNLYGDSITTVNLQGLTNLTDLTITQSSVMSLNLTGLSALVNIDITHNDIVSAIDLTQKPALVNFDASYNFIPSLSFTGSVNLQQINLQRNNLHEIELSGLTNLISLNLGQNYLQELNVDGFTQLETLSLLDNDLTQLDIHTLANLKFLSCNNNDLTAIDPQGLIHLETIDIAHNDITELNVQGLTNLKSLTITDNQISTLDAHGFPLLKFLYCQSNQLTSLNVTGLPLLEYFHCENNHLTNIDINDLTQLGYLICNDNLLTTLSIENCPHVNQVICQNNLLSTLYLKNGKTEGVVTFSNNPGLTYICSDEGQVSWLQSQAVQAGLPGIEVNSYCNNAEYPSYGVQGNVNFYTIPANTTGPATPVANLQIYNSQVSRRAITDFSGFYSFLVDGTTTNSSVTPIFENPSLFGYSDPSYSIQNYYETITKNINIWPANNAVLNTADLEIVLMPLSSPLSGQNAVYILLVRNKGNKMTSGTASLSFDDAALNFVSASPEATAQPNLLTWNFQDLPPFGTMTMKVVFYVNTPTATPPIELGYPLEYTATAQLSAGNDYTPADNVFVYPDKVVSSYDPNDKICLQGELIPTADIGKYVYYRIRFENTGTANANRVIVSDVLDTSKFDTNSFIPIAASHDYSTRINENKVEFIFNNINLPFDDENNDGYVVFKIKTKSTLTNGSTFSNSAKIYFDYNLPIITNTYTTSVGVPQPPAIATGQQFCNGAVLHDVVLGNPVATIRWYTAQTGGTQLSNDLVLTNGTTYYAAQVINNIESTSRTAVAVTISTTASPQVAGGQEFCGSATIADLESEGSEIHWYNAPTGSIALSQDTPLINGTTYYATQTINGCESSRLPVTVTVNTTAEPQAAGTQEFCNAATINDLAISDAVNIRWYTSLTGNEELTGETSLSNGMTYYATQTINGCESSRLPVAVTINTTTVPDAAASQVFCTNATVSQLQAVTGAGAILNWYSAETGGSPLDQAAGLENGVTYYASQSINGCESARSGVVVVITTIEPPQGPAVQTIEEGASLSDLEVSVTGTITWYATQEDAENSVNAISSNYIPELGTQTFFATQAVNGCESAVYSVTVTTTLSLENFNENGFTLYPNPVSDVLTLSYDKAEGTIEIFNLLGQKVYSSEIRTNRTSVDMSHYPVGAYIVKVSNGDAGKAVKIMKQ